MIRPNMMIKVITLPLLLILLSSCMGGYTYTPPAGAAAADMFAATGNSAMIPLTITTNASSGNYAEVKKIFEKYPEFKNKRSEDTNVRIITGALTTACGAKVVNMNLIEYLVKNGADVNGDYRGAGTNGIASSPLTAVLLQIANTTNPSLKKGQEEYEAKMRAVYKSSGKKVSPSSSLEERLVVLEYLIKSGADVNLKTDMGTPFTSAIYSKRAMEMLIKAGADTSETERSLAEGIERNQQSIALLKKYK